MILYIWLWVKIQLLQLDKLQFFWRQPCSPSSRACSRMLLDLRESRAWAVRPFGGPKEFSPSCEVLSLPLTFTNVAIKWWQETLLITLNCWVDSDKRNSSTFFKCFIKKFIGSWTIWPLAGPHVPSAMCQKWGRTEIPCSSLQSLCGNLTNVGLSATSSDTSGLRPSSRPPAFPPARLWGWAHSLMFCPLGEEAPCSLVFVLGRFLEGWGLRTGAQISFLIHVKEKVLVLFFPPSS